MPQVLRNLGTVPIAFQRPRQRKLPCDDDLLLAHLPGPIANIDRLVVAEDCAGQGLSLVLDRVGTALARSQACHCVVAETFTGIGGYDELLEQCVEALGRARQYRDLRLKTVKQSRGEGIGSILWL